MPFDGQVRSLNSLTAAVEGCPEFDSEFDGLNHTDEFVVTGVIPVMLILDIDFLGRVKCIICPVDVTRETKKSKGRGAISEPKDESVEQDAMGAPKKD